MAVQKIYGKPFAMTNKHVAYQAIGPAKGQAGGRMMGIVVAVVIFVSLVAGVRHISGSLGTQPVNVAQTTAAAGDIAAMPTVFTPPEANYDKVDIRELPLRKSSYSVRPVVRRPRVASFSPVLRPDDLI